MHNMHEVGNSNLTIMYIFKQTVVISAGGNVLSKCAGIKTTSFMSSGGRCRMQEAVRLEAGEWKEKATSLRYLNSNPTE